MTSLVPILELNILHPRLFNHMIGPKLHMIKISGFIDGWLHHSIVH